MNPHTSAFVTTQRCSRSRRKIAIGLWSRIDWNCAFASANCAFASASSASALACAVMSRDVIVPATTRPLRRTGLNVDS